MLWDIFYMQLCLSVGCAHNNVNQVWQVSCRWTWCRHDGSSDVTAADSAEETNKQQLKRKLITADTEVSFCGRRRMLCFYCVSFVVLMSRTSVRIFPLCMNIECIWMKFVGHSYYQQQITFWVKLYWRHGNMWSWEHGDMGTCDHGNMATWEHVIMGTWRDGNMATWEHVIMGTWHHGDMGTCHHGKHKVHFRVLSCKFF